MKKSIWGFSDLSVRTTKKNIDTDVLIIGGGITGMTTALLLSDSNKKVCLIDANKVGNGITAKTTGKISVMQEYTYQKIYNISKNLAYDYLDSQVFAVKALVNIIKKYHIKCDLKKNDSYLFTNDKKNIDKIIREKDILDRVLKCEIINKLPNDYPCLYGIKTNYSYVFNPIKYISSIKEICNDKIDIYENTRALNISKKIDYFLVKTNKNKIKAKKVIICTHYPIFVKKLFFPIVTSITKEYVIGARVDKSYNSNMICNDDKVISIRYHDDFMIYASGNDLLGGKLKHAYNMNNVISNFKKHFNFPIEYTWYNYDITSCDYLPIIDKVNKDIFVATAYNKWGMSNSTLAAFILSDMVMGNKNQFADLVSINRNSLKNLSCLKNMYDNVVTYFKPKKSNIKYEVKEGIEYATYTDKDGVSHRVINKCPHLGCKLIFNDFDKTWDCPCHGSRFNLDGKVIHGPSMFSIKPKK